MARLLTIPLLCLALLGLPALAQAQTSAADPSAEASLRKTLTRQIRAAGRFSGAYVANATENRGVFRFRADRARILASNTKLFTTAAALARFGSDGHLATTVRGEGNLEPDGTWRGSLYLVGGGDPTFGSRSFGSRNYGAGGAVEDLATALQGAGIRRVSGRIVGDETAFDGRRGGPSSGYRTSGYVGPLSGLAFNRGLATESGRGFQSRPALFAAARLHSALGRRGIGVAVSPRTGDAPAATTELASEQSPEMARLAMLTNRPSDNFFAEMLLKDVGLHADGRGTTGGGARAAVAFARALGARPRLADGSGLSRRNRASPRSVVRLLLGMRRRGEGDAYTESLAIAGRNGTLRSRMRRGPARRKCRAKTGTISGVSTLSGYCRARSRQVYAFSFLMNGVSPSGARRIQDRMAQAVAGVR
ncbi:MAG TPA: D-alanyl-D-alanine carboxypeptidase/D-alanyl-D-alanine-endopeptidase [Thermoleophilaceae bacterium]|nr:D-alanyl-D-alanine carboxypeptidase/D-alanyl-D-alanine-endopeptidase [Thermoleophilaceae bacterium]